MSRIRKYVHAWVDNRHGAARARYYFRRRGHKQLPLPGIPGAPEFEAAYAAALAGAEPVASTIGAKRIRVGTVDALAIAYLNSPGFMVLAPSTARVYRGIVERFAAEHGAKPLAGLTRKHIEAMLAKKATKSAAANNWLVLLKQMTAYGVAQGLMAQDPLRRPLPAP